MRLAKSRESLLRIRTHFLRRHFSMSSTPPVPDSDRYSFNPILKWDPNVESYLSRAYGSDHFSRISSALARPSCYSSIRVNTLKSSTEQVCQKLQKILLETNFTDNNTNCISLNPSLNNVLLVHGTGPHSIDYARQPGEPFKEVIISRKCAESILRGAQIYVPGVMACSAHVEQGDKVAVSVATEQETTGTGGWTLGITRGTVLHGHLSDVQYKERHGLYIGQGVALMSRVGIFRAKEGIAIQMIDRVYNLPSFNDVLEGEIFLQNLPSIVTARVLDPKAGERILDMCAAPGGKTTAIAILMGDKGEIIALDRSHNKVMGIMKLADEMGIKCIKAYKLDALKSVNSDIDNNPSNEPLTGDLHFIDQVNEDNDKSTPVSSQNDPSTRDLHLIDQVNGGKDKSNPLNSQNEPSTGDLHLVDQVNGGKDKGNPLNSQNEPSTGDLHLVDQVSGDEGRNGNYKSNAEMRKSLRRMRNGPGRNNIKGGRVVNSKGFKPDSFDRVLLDAPCSALGLRPRLFAAMESIETLRRHGTYQRRLFDQAVQLVRPGGVIVYSTCTINPGENEALVRYALDTYKFLSLAPQDPRLGGPGVVGRCEFEDSYIEEWLTDSEADLVQRFDPVAEIDTIGFFIAKFNVGAKNI